VTSRVQPEDMGKRVQHLDGTWGTLYHDPDDDWPPLGMVDVEWDDGYCNIVPEDELIFVDPKP
jgi:hypothetical protein